MSRRVAVRNSGDTVEKFAFLAPLASAAMGTVGRAAATKVGQTALGQGAKSMAGKLAESKVGQMAGKVASKTKDVLGEDAGKKIGEAGAAMAQMQQQKQQAMQQQNQQMADKAKAGSQIATGEAMDMSWQMLKAWSFLPGFDEFDKHSIIQHAKKMKLQHVSIHDLGHHDKRFNERYKPDQEMPKGAEKLTPRDLSLAYMDLMLRRNPELIERGNQKSKVGGKDEFGNPHPDNFPGISFPLLQTDEPIRSQVKTDKGRMIEQYHPVFAAGHAHHEPSEHPKFALVTANDAATQAGNRNTIGVTHTVNRYSHEHFPIVDDAASDAFYNVMYEQEQKQKRKQGKDEYDFEEKEESPQARNKRIITDEINRRHFGDFLQPIDFERMKAGGLSPSITQRIAEQRVHGQNPMAVEADNPLLIYPDGSPLARQYRSFQAKNPPADDGDDGGDGGGGGGGGGLPNSTFLSHPSPPIHLGGGMYMWRGNYYGGLGQPPLPPEAEAMIQNGEPMDMAWRMLKGELQLPHQITEALRGDLTTLDRAHKMTDTNEGTLIEGIHPDMENVVKLLAEKHMGDISPTMQRPVMPLFHSPFH
jgi:hypothetical protein